MCSKLIIKTGRRQWRISRVFIVNFEHISHLSLLFLLNLKEWSRQYQLLSIWNFEVLTGHRKSLKKKSSLILEIFLFSLEFCVANVQLTRRVFPILLWRRGATENIITQSLINQIQISCVRKTAIYSYKFMLTAKRRGIKNCMEAKIMARKVAGRWKYQSMQFAFWRMLWTRFTYIQHLHVHLYTP